MFIQVVGGLLSVWSGHCGGGGIGEKMEGVAGWGEITISCKEGRRKSVGFGFGFGF